MIGDQSFVSDSSGTSVERIGQAALGSMHEACRVFGSLHGNPRRVLSLCGKIPRPGSSYCSSYCTAIVQPAVDFLAHHNSRKNWLPAIVTGAWPGEVQSHHKLPKDQPAARA